MTTMTIIYAYALTNDKTLWDGILTEMEFRIGPPLFFGFFIYFTIKPIVNLIDCVTETLLICFVADEEMFLGKQRFYEQDMRDWMDKYGYENELKVDAARFKDRKDEDLASLITKPAVKRKFDIEELDDNLGDVKHYYNLGL